MLGGPECRWPPSWWGMWPPGREGINIGWCWKECKNRGRFSTELSILGVFVPRGDHGIAEIVPAHKQARILEVKVVPFDLRNTVYTWKLV